MRYELVDDAERVHAFYEGQRRPEIAWWRAAKAIETGEPVGEFFTLPWWTMERQTSGFLIGAHHNTHRLRRLLKAVPAGHSPAGEPWHIGVLYPGLPDWYFDDPVGVMTRKGHVGLFSSVRLRGRPRQARGHAGARLHPCGRAGLRRRRRVSRRAAALRSGRVAVRQPVGSDRHRPGRETPVADQPLAPDGDLPGAAWPNAALDLAGAPAGVPHRTARRQRARPARRRTWTHGGRRRTRRGRLGCS